MRIGARLPTSRYVLTTQTPGGCFRHIFRHCETVVVMWHPVWVHSLNRCILGSETTCAICKHSRLTSCVKSDIKLDCSMSYRQDTVPMGRFNVIGSSDVGSRPTICCAWRLTTRPLAVRPDGSRTSSGRGIFEEAFSKVLETKWYSLCNVSCSPTFMQPKRFHRGPPTTE